MEEQEINCTCSVVLKKSENNKNDRRESRLGEIDLMIAGNGKEGGRLKRCLSCYTDRSVSKKEFIAEELEEPTIRPHSFTF